MRNMGTVSQKMNVKIIIQQKFVVNQFVISVNVLRDILKHVDSMQVWNSASLWTPACMTTRRLTKTDL